MNTKMRGWKGVRAGLGRRVLSLALAALMLWGLLPELTPKAAAAEWMESYLETLVDWGIMRGNGAGDLNPDRVLTRAEFVTLVNRAFGYTERGTTPFRDVPENAWYADDINIAYQAGYFSGTSETTANPTGRVTREQAAVMLGRNLRMQGTSGAYSDFADVYQMGNWSRGMIQECAEMGIIQGYADGTFRPRNYITRGQMACFLVRALGTLVSKPGEQIAGGVYGNLTVNSPNVKLKDTVVTGNLYLTGGVGLGSVELENVTVMGKIVVCGAGEAERGQSSIILRNVTADTLEIDSLGDHFMTVRTEGLTNIANTTVRTSAYLEDVTEDDQGLRVITLDGADGARLQLAGNIKEVVNITPNSDLQVVQGVTDKLTVDERAAGSALSIANDTTVRILNLDTGTAVTGNGDVSHMNVNAAGSTATMLPDTIFVRPGITSNIHNQVMDNIAAEESSDEPRLLAGYPLVRNLASTSADGVFSTNKRGTLYWAVSTLLDGSVGEDELRNPSAYPGKVLRSGTINVTASKTEMTARITGLSREGSYYISAMLVDERGHTSPVKVFAFTTTDDSTPAFVTGYPQAVLYVSPEDEQVIQARVMANKTCRLYYALLPQSATAPSAADMRSGAIPGNLGYGTMEVRKNTAYTIPKVNSAYLQEKTTYALYLWLNDSDNGKSSSVQRLLVTTKDMTPPVIQRLEATGVTGTSITMTYSLSEPGTLYWAIVKKGTPFYSKDIEEVGTPPSQANNELAKMQIKRGLGVKRGSSNAAREDTDVNFTITGLDPQTSYDLYYVAEDRDGNFNIYTTTLTPPMQVNTLDEQGPTVAQEFTHDGSDGNVQHPTPYTDTSIRLVFSEEVQGIDSTSQQEPSNFLSLYNSGEKGLLAAALAKHIRLYYKPALDQPILLTEEPTAYGWINYAKARVEPDASGSGELIITFPQEEQGLGLASGATYYFELEGIYDTANPQPNQLQNTTRGILKLPEFTTLFATVNLALSAQRTIQVDGTNITVNRSFTATPSGTDTVSEETYWDMLFWTNTTMNYTLYSRTREKDASGSWNAWGAWEEAGDRSTIAANVAGSPDGRVYASLSGFVKCANSDSRQIPHLNTLDYQTEFAIKINNTESDPNESQDVIMEIMVVAGDLNSVEAVAEQGGNGWKTALDRALADGAVQINAPNPFNITIPMPGRAPELVRPFPEMMIGDIGATIRVTIDRPGTVYYLAVPVTPGDPDNDVEDVTVGGIATKRLTGTNYSCDISPMTGPVGSLTAVDFADIPLNGSDGTKKEVDSPSVGQVSRGVNGLVYGSSADGNRGMMDANVARPLNLTGLTPETFYVLYLVTQDSTGVFSEKAVCYQFYTQTAELPIIRVTRNGNLSARIEVNKSALLHYALVPTNSLTESGSLFKADFTARDNAIDSYPGISGVTSVLDAMRTDYQGKGSVFDNFATSETKLAYGTLIRGLENQGSVPPIPLSPSDGDTFIHDGSSTWTGKNITMPDKEMVGTNYYTLLVVGHSLNSDESNDAFRASQPYFNQDTAPLTVKADAFQSSKPTDVFFDGTLRVDFSAELHYRVRNSSSGIDNIYPLDDCDRADGRHTAGANTVSDGFKNIGSIMNIQAVTGGSGVGTGTITLRKQNYHGHNVGSILWFDVKNAGINSVISFEPNLCGPNGTVRENQSLLLTLKRRLTVPPTPTIPPTADTPGQEGTKAEYEWYLEVTPAAWQG